MTGRFVRTGLLFLILGVGLGSVAAARYIQWKPEEKPPVLLPAALVLADAELGKKGEEYHCISATLAKTFTGGDWELRYSSAKGKSMWVSVGSDKSVRTSERGFEY